MKGLRNIFSLTKNRKSIPKSWCGRWTDTRGKQLIIESTKHDFYTVTLLDFNGKPFQIELLGNNTKETVGLLGQFQVDTKGNPMLQVEAGNIDLGPTLNLYFLAMDNNQKLRLAKNSDGLEKLIIKPNVGIGLYDDWEENLGVPWAFPLEDFYKVKN